MSPAVFPPVQFPSSATGLPEEPKMCSFEVPDCNSALGQSSQDLKMHRLMVTAAKAVLYLDSIQESFSLFVRKSSNRQSPLFTSSAVWIINIVLL